MPPTLAIFDLDYTILNGDSEMLWARFLNKQGIVSDEFVRQMERYYDDYERGKLDMISYEEFLLQPLTSYQLEELNTLRVEYLEWVAGLIRPQMMDRVAWHRKQGHLLLLITASNSFIVEPIARALGFEHVICSQVEFDGDKLTGRLDGMPAYRGGKVKLLGQWLEKNQMTLADSWGYSDSHNDLPLLSLVDHPVVVSPSDALYALAKRNQWEIILI